MHVSKITMSSSSRPRTRGQVAEYIKNIHSELKRKRQFISTNVCSEKTSGEIKESLVLGENSRKVKKTRNVGVKGSFSEGNGRKGKRKSVISNVGSLDRVLRKKTQLSEDDENSDGFEFTGEEIVTNGSVFLKKSCEKNDEIVEKDEIFMKKGVNNGENGGKKGKEKEFSNVGCLDISDKSKDDDEIEVLSNGSSSSCQKMEKGEIFMKKGVERGEKGVKNCSVSSENAKKKGKEKKFSNVGSLDKDLSTGNQLDINDGSGDDDDGIAFRDEMNDVSDSSLSFSSADKEESGGFEFQGEKTVTSLESDDEDMDDGFESGSSLKSRSVLDVSDSYGNYSPANSVEVKHMPQNHDFPDLVSGTSDSESSSGDSDECADQSECSGMSELESSSEEEDEDDSDDEYNVDEPLISDDSLVSPYSSSHYNDVEFVSQRDDGTGGVDENKESDAFVEKTLRSGKKVKRMEFLRDNKDVEYVSHRDIGKNGKGENKDNGVFVGKVRISRKKIKGMNRKKENDAGLNKDYRSDKGNSAESGLRKKKVPGIETKKFCKKDPQCGKSTWPPPIVESDELGSSTDDNPESLKQECSGEKKGTSKEDVMNLGRKTSRSARNADLIRMLFNSMNEDNNVEESGFFQESLPLKFRFEEELEPPAEKSEQEKVIESLFLEMELCFRASEMESANWSKTESDDISSKEVDESPEACCGRGEHQPILDEQIGAVCRFCGAIVLEIKDILPPWYKPRSRRQERKYFDEPPSFVHGEFQFHESAKVYESFMPAKGTVWDLIPGFEKGMFRHQREGFEFLWKSIGGDVEIEKLPKSLSDDGRGCIISHAPGTGKTRLAVVFLLSFLKRYRNIYPVIIAPQVILSTWEKEFVKWKSDIPFHNMNNLKLSGNETRFGGGTEAHGVRLAKLLSWIRGGGILGISYQLLGSLVGEKGKQEEIDVAIRNTLIKKPGLLVLDEGHTPRNGKSRIWNAIKNVESKRCIILSGTPFQNTFKELKHTLCLVDARFHKMDESSWKELIEGDDGIKKLRSLLDPYVNLHEGSVLQKSLLGLKDTIICFRPTKLQKKLMNAAMKEKIVLTRTHLVSLISVHPSALLIDETKKFIRSRIIPSYKDKLQEIVSDLDEGVKIKFVMNLIKLADSHGERVLIFSEFISPLVFIKEQLKTHFSWSEGKEVLYMDGHLVEKKRQVSISSFNNGQTEAKVLLASLRACSEGISLVGASRVVLLDTVWNPSVERQAISRAYRLGQKKMVYVYRLITKMEVRQCELQARKVSISKSIFSRVDENDGEIEASPMVSEDKLLEQMLQIETVRAIIEKIIHQPKESDFSESFWFADD